jgi:RHS repeat-associated protein
MTLADGARWRYQYDVHGQLTLGKKSWSDGVPVTGEQFEYLFDDIGNRVSTLAGGNASGTGLRSATYTRNLLNQYSSYSVPEAFDVLGSAPPGASVTVNGGATYRKGDFWQAQPGGNNSTGAVAVAVNVQSVSNTVTLTSNGVVFLPRSSVTNAYDADGNLTTNGQFSFAWDAENRLVSFTPLSGTPTNQWQAGRLGYDYVGRRISRAVSNYVAGVWQLAFDHRYVYDGWNLLAVLDASGAVLLSFTWGSDLSGSLQGAGGVGGLMSMTVHSGPLAGTYFYVFDGNGNVVALVNALDGSVAAQYEYGPFGELLRCTGPLAALNPFRFSTKFQDDETGLLYYGYRYYDPETGRWPNRDPIGERGGRNLYAFVGNDPIGDYDALGLRAEFPKRDLNKYKACRRSSLIAKLLQGGVGPGDYKKDCCQKITVLIKLPLCTARGLDGKGLGGHTGIGIEDEFYDYGPDVGNDRGLNTPKSNPVFGIPGYQWWDDPERWNGNFTPDDIGLSDILGNIGDLAQDEGKALDVFKIEISVSADEAKRARDYWRDKYSDLGTYSVLGGQCTTTVMNSLDQAGIFNRPFLTFKPIGFLNSLKSATHTCGPNKGKPVKIEHINQEAAPAACGKP